MIRESDDVIQMQFYFNGLDAIKLVKSRSLHDFPSTAEQAGRIAVGSLNPVFEIQNKEKV